VINSRVTLDDPLCDQVWPYRCAHYRLIAPGDGVIDFVMTCPALADKYVVDIGVIDPAGRMWISAEAEQWRLGPQRTVRIPVTAGATYVIEIWSLGAPGEMFELKTSYRPGR
jgi:hypothetical protein